MSSTTPQATGTEGNAAEGSKVEKYFLQGSPQADGSFYDRQIKVWATDPSGQVIQRAVAITVPNLDHKSFQSMTPSARDGFATAIDDWTTSVVTGVQNDIKHNGEDGTSKGEFGDGGEADEKYSMYGNEPNGDDTFFKGPNENCPGGAFCEACNTVHPPHLPHNFQGEAPRCWCGTKHQGVGTAR